MIKKKIIAILFYLSFSLVLVENGLAWRVEAKNPLDGTHQLLARFATEVSVLGSCIHQTDTNCDYLNNIGMLDGLEELLIERNKERNIINWIVIGAEKEDTGAVGQLIPTGKRPRYLNHFHNPLFDWDTAGLDDLLIFTGESSLVWAQDTQAQQNPYNPEGDWTWSTIREDFYRALTSDVDTERQAALARTFRGLGHQLHLLQDKSVPAHVRNDAHPMSTNDFGLLTLEAWAQREFESLDKLTTFLEDINISEFIPTAFFENYNNFHEIADAPITQLVDTNQYDGINPSTTTTSASIGLAEYTNANFVSDDTVFTEDNSPNDKHFFPYPRKTSTNLSDPLLPTMRVAKDGIADQIIKVSKKTDGEIIDNFLKASYLTYNIDILSDYSLYLRSFYLDEDCHEEAAKLLIPRAVGYSTALLDYFFRGKMSLENYNCEDGQYVIKNYSDEDMTGTFSLYYDDADNVRHLITNWDSLTIAANSESTTLLFDFPAFFETTGIPAPKKPNTYMLVFEGTMGNENGAVAGTLVLLERIWCEEWDNGLKGNHDWLYTGIDFPNQNSPGIGETINSETGGSLIKENIRYSVQSDTVHVNENLLGFDFNPAGSDLPWPITGSTWIRTKIDEMSLTPDIPTQECDANSNSGVGFDGRAGEQAVKLLVTDNDNTKVAILFTNPGHEPLCPPYDYDRCIYVYFNSGEERAINVFDEIVASGITPVEPVNVVGIDFFQQFAPLCTPYPDQTQRMVVDYLRIVDWIGN